MKPKLSQNCESGETAACRPSAGSHTGWTGNAGWATRVLGLAAILVLARPSDTWAYVDPATGSYLLQMLFAGIIAAALALRMFWTNVKLFFRKLFSGRKPDETDQSP